jgi:glutathione S-transferase
MSKPYRLYGTPTSPFARKCRMVARELNLMDQVEEFSAKVRTPENEVLDVSPLGKVPTFTGPDGLALVDSTIICEYLDHMNGAPVLHGADFPDRLKRSGDWALAESLLESLAWLAREFRRPTTERSPSFIAYESGRQTRVYDWLETNTPTEATRDVSHIGLVVALDYSIYRFEERDWRPGRPRLSAWFERECARPAFVDTVLPAKV